MENTIRRNTFTNKAMIVFVCYTSIMMLGIYLAFFQYTVLNITQKFNLSSGMIGLFVALQSVGMAVSPFVLGVLSGKIGKKKTILISIGLLVVGMLLAGLSVGVATYICSVFLIGAGYAVTEATLSAVLTDEFSNYSTMHLNFSQVCFSGGAFLGPLIAKKLIENAGVYFQDLYFLIAVPLFIMGLLFFFTRHYNDDRSAQKVRTLSVVKHLKSRVIVLLFISIFLYVGLENTSANFTDSYFELQLGMPQFSAQALSFFWLAMMPSRFLAGILMRNTKRLIAGLSTITIASFILAVTLNDPTIKIVMFAVCGFGCGPMWPLIMDRIAKRSKGYTAPMLNIAFAFCGFGAAVLPFATGLLVNATSQSAAYYLCAVAAVLMLVCILATKDEHSKKTLKQ